MKNKESTDRKPRNFIVEELSGKRAQTLESIFEQIREAQEDRMKRDDALLKLMKEKKDRGGCVWVLYKYGRLRDWAQPHGGIEGVFATHEAAAAALGNIIAEYEDCVNTDEDTWFLDTYYEETTYKIERVEVEFGKEMEGVEQ